MEDKLFSYNPRLLSHLDWVRYHLGDTEVRTAELDDREIEAILADEDVPVTDPYTNLAPTASDWRSYRALVASRGAEAIAAKHARDADVQFDNQRVGMSSKFVQYRQLAKELHVLATKSVPLRVIRW